MKCVHLSFVLLEINLYLEGTYGNPRRARNGEVVGSKRTPAMNPRPRLHRSGKALFVCSFAGADLRGFAVGGKVGKMASEEPKGVNVYFVKG